MIILEYIYGLPRAPRQRRGQHKNSAAMLGELGLAWCQRVVDYANDWDSDDLIDLLATGMIRMRPEERLSAGACFTKGCDLGLFDGHSRDSGCVTPTRRTALQGGINDDDGSTTILLGALWGMEESSNHGGNSQTGHCTLEHNCGVLESRNLRVSSSPSNGDDHGSQLGSFATGLNHLGDNVQSPADLSRPLEVGSIHPGRYKRQRSPAVGSAKNSSDRDQIKRRPLEVRLIQVHVSHPVEIPDRCLGHDGQSDQFCTIYDAVLDLLADILGIKSQDIDIDDHISTLIRELSEFLTRLEITGMRLTRSDLSGHDIVATDLNNQEIVLASLTPFKPMSSIADLASHLLHLVQLQSPQSASISTVPVERPFSPGMYHYE